MKENRNKELRGNNDILAELLVDGEFTKLDKDLQHKIIDIVTVQYNTESKTKHGKLSEFLGSESYNISLYIAGLISITIIVIGLIYILIPLKYKQDSNIDFWNLIIPIITTTLGYIFGKSTSDK